MTAQTVSSAVAKRDTGPISIMMSSKRQFAAVLPQSVDVDAFLGTMAGALYSNRDLMAAAQTSPDSLYTALMRCAALGHMPGTDEYYLTPRKAKGRLTVLGIEGYRGVVERMYRSGAVAMVIVREVCARDLFRYVEGEDERPVHRFGGTGTAGTGADWFGAEGSRDRGLMVGVYAYAKLLTGAYSRPAILNRDDVHAARAAGGWKPDDQYSPWNRADAGTDHPEFTGRSMWWKTAVKRLEPWVPTSAEYRREMLRASSAAASAASLVGAPAPGSNGSPAPVAPEEIFDAELVGEPAVQDGKPSQVKLDHLLASLDLGPESDVLAVLEWLGGAPWTGSVTQVRTARSALDDFVRSAGGDLGRARDDVWVRYRQAHPGERQEAAGGK